MNFKKFSVILVVSILAALSFNTVFADSDSLYPVGEWYYQLEFNDSSKQEADAFPGGKEGTYPIVETFDGEGVATFDSLRYDTNRCGFNFDKKTDTFTAFKDALGSGSEVSFEYRAYFGGMENYYRQLFGTFLKIYGEKNHILFSNWDNYINTYLNAIEPGAGDLQIGWHTISVVLYTDNGTVKAKNFKVDSYTIPDEKLKIGTSFDTVDELLNDIRVYTDYSIGKIEGVMYLDYMRIYKIKTLNYKSADIEIEKVPQNTEIINLEFDYPLDDSSASTAVQIVDEGGNPVDLESSVGSSPEILSVTLNEPLSYSNWYNIIISGLLESVDNVEYSGSVAFYTENEPKYHLDNLNLSAKSIDVKSVLPKEQSLYFVTQIYNSEGKLIEADLSDVAVISKEESESFKTFSIMSKDVPSGAAKVKIFVFDGDLKNIFTMLESDI